MATRNTSRLSTSEVMAKVRGTAPTPVPRPAASRAAVYYADGHICALDPSITPPYLDHTKYRDRVMSRFVRYSSRSPATCGSVTDGAAKVQRTAEETSRKIESSIEPVVGAVSAIRGVAGAAGKGIESVKAAAIGTQVPASKSSAPAPAPASAPAPAPARVRPPAPVQAPASPNDAAVQAERLRKALERAGLQ